jgi:uncharacterized protein (TIGR04206 family)
MAWVRSEYAGELAVLLTWASVLLPWSASITSREGISLVVVRFVPVAFRFLFGVELRGGEVPVLPVWAAPGFPEGATVALANRIWLAAAAVHALAFAVSVGYYLREDDVERSLAARLGPGAGDPVRLLGALLGLAGLGYLAAVALLWRGYAGLTLPIGAALVPVFGAILLRVERTDPELTSVPEA